MRTKPAHAHSLVQMQFPRTAVIEQPVRHIGPLLDFAQRQSRADGVHRPRGNEERVARTRLMPLQQVFDFARERGFTQPLFRDRFAKPSGDLRARLGRQDVPHLGLAFGMHLYGQRFRREQELDEKRRLRSIRRPLKPHFADFLRCCPDTRAPNVWSPKLSAETAESAACSIYTRALMNRSSRSRPRSSSFIDVAYDMRI